MSSAANVASTIVAPAGIADVSNETNASLSSKLAPGMNWPT